jgi:ABC-type amino acid transport substrate-binding protein
MTNSFLLTIRHRIALLSLIAALMLLAGALTQARASEPCRSTLDTVRSYGVLIAGLLTQNVPYGYLNVSGANTGFDADMAKDSAKRPDVRGELRRITAAPRIPLPVSGSSDVAIAATAIARKRGEAVDFTWPYGTEGGKIPIQRGEKFAGLTGPDRQIVVFPQGLSCFSDIVKAHPAIKAPALPAPATACLALLQGMAAATVLNATPPYRPGQGNPKVEILAVEAWEPKAPALAIRQDDPRWRSALNYALNDLRRIGTDRSLHQKNCGQLPDPRFSANPYGI